MEIVLNLVCEFVLTPCLLSVYQSFKFSPGSETHPLVVYGESGCGKTSILSMVLKSCQEWCLDESAIVIRHLGITPDSSLLRKLLSSLCQQIALLIGRDYDPKQRKVLGSFRFLLSS